MLGIEVKLCYLSFDFGLGIMLPALTVSTPGLHLNICSIYAFLPSVFLLALARHLFGNVLIIWEENHYGFGLRVS